MPNAISPLLLERRHLIVYNHQICCFVECARWFVSRIFWVFFGLLGAFSPHGIAQTYPSRNITVIVPFAAGDDADTSAHTLIPLLQKYLKGGAFLIENQPGESGIPSTQRLHKSPADGYTLMLAKAGNLVIAPILSPKSNYAWRDFSVLALLEFDTLVCVVPATSQLQTPRDVIKQIKTQPGGVRYGSVGRSSVENFAVMQWLKLSGVKPSEVELVDFPSSAHVVQALTSEKVDFACTSAVSANADLRSGKLRGLFTSSVSRLSAFPKLPTAQEVGLRDMNKIVGWSALLGPPNLPDPILKRWRGALKEAINDPLWSNELERQGRVRPPKGLAFPEDFVEDQSDFYEDIFSGLALKR